MKLQTLFILVPFAGILASCVTVEPPTETKFLSSYSGLEKQSKLSGALIYRGNLSKMDNYDKVYVEDVAMQGTIAEKSADGKDINQRKLANEAEAEMLAESFEESLKAAFGSTMEVVSRPQRGSLTVRAAVVEMEPNRPLVFAATYAPYASTASTAMRVITGKSPGAGSVMIQAEIVDSMTKERFLAYVDEDQTSKTELLGGLSRWGRAKSAFRGWSKKFHKTVSEAAVADVTPVRVASTDSKKPVKPTQVDAPKKKLFFAKNKEKTNRKPLFRRA